MVVLAAAVLTRGGKALLARQFVAMTRPRIEGLLAAFPKLVAAERAHSSSSSTSSGNSSTSSSSSSQGPAHTFVETDSVRYLYQGVEQLHVIVITNKASNILADLDTLHLLAKLVPEFAHGADEASVLRHCFDVVNAFDECVTMGQKERVSVQQVKHFCSMESHDEERAKVEEAEKHRVATERAKAERKKIELRHAEQRKMGGMGGGMGGGMSGMGSGGSQFGSGAVYGGGSSIGAHSATAVERHRAPEAPEGRRGAGGMRLGAGSGTRLGAASGTFSAALAEEGVPDTSSQPAAFTGAADSAPLAAQSGDPVQIACREVITLVADNDGGLESMVVSGELGVTVYDESFANVQIQLEQFSDAGFQIKTHPNMDKQSFASGVLALRSGRAYPIGAETSVLKWRLATNDDNAVPLRINVWPSTQAGETIVPIEYEKNCEFALSDVVVTIPIPGPAPVVGDVTGSFDFDQRKGLLYWRIPLIDSAAPGSLEFTVPAADHASFLPVTVSFVSDETFAPIRPAKVGTPEGAQPKYSCVTSLSTDRYEFQ